MNAIYEGIEGSERWDHLRREELDDDGGVNVGRTERLISGVAGVALGLYTLRRKRLRGLLLPVAGTLISRAVTGRCAVNRALGRNSALGEERASPVASVGRGEGIKVEQAVSISRPREELYRFWRNFENLPRFMDHLESVRVLDEQRSHWVAKGPAGSRVEWDAEIHNEIPNELIAWRSLPGSEVDHAGSVHFSPAHEDGTEVRVILRYDPPAGKLGAAVARLFGEDPSHQVAEDLRRFKQVMEADDLAGTTRA
ncbi:MAG TPA: SRPBCC family protein [Gemmatimonadales bacterium]|nr:SRPBCC family protein [Gemmatimonadales bacterium]